jgi:hypothetical protein
MPLLSTPNSENQAINTPLSEQKPAKFEKSRLGAFKVYVASIGRAKHARAFFLTRAL